MDVSESDPEAICDINNYGDHDLYKAVSIGESGPGGNTGQYEAMFQSEAAEVWFWYEMNKMYPLAHFRLDPSLGPQPVVIPSQGGDSKACWYLDIMTNTEEGAIALHKLQYPPRQ
ncbi:hypothetical protein ACHAPU_009045 [Fusarium lateritium]